VWPPVAIGLLIVGGPLSLGGAPPVGELRIGIARLPESLDPIQAGTGPGLIVSRAVYQGLVEVGERGDIEPGLASHWSVSRDGLTWTFRLRSDVQFHNGTPLTADVVVTSLSRHLGLEEPGARAPVVPWGRLFSGSQAIVREVRRGEAGTVQIQLTQPFSPLLGVLAHPGLAIALTPPETAAAPIGTGPYRVADRGAGRLTLEATARPRGESPRSARLIIEEFGDDAAALAELAPGGRLHVYFPQSPPTWAGLGLQTLSAPTWQVGWLALRTREGLLTRKPVRQAIGFALDPALVGPALGRRARPWGSYLPPGTWALRPLPAPTHDPIRARRLLADARVTQGTLALLAAEGSSGPDPARLTEAIRLSLAVAGLTLQVRQVGGEAYLQALREGEAELALFEHTVEIDDPHFALRPLVGSEFAVRGSATNVAFYRNPLVDGLLLRGSQFAFRPERLRLYQRLQAQLAEELPYIPLYVRQQWAVARPTVRGLRLDPAGRHRLDRVWLELPPEPAPPPPAATPVPAPPPALPVPSLPPPPDDVQ
jgi:peptide/nickel transport system substrate-binding protein